MRKERKESGDLRAGDLAGRASLVTLTLIPSELDVASFSLAVHSRTVNVFSLLDFNRVPLAFPKPNLSQSIR